MTRPSGKESVAARGRIPRGMAGVASDRPGPQRKNLRVQSTTPKEPRRSLFPKDRVPILTFDPGETTGWSLLVLPKEIDGQDIFSYTPDVILRNKIVWEHGELNCKGVEDDAAWQMSRMCYAWPSAAIVIEDFILRAERKEKSRELLSPVRLTAKLELLLWQNGQQAFKQDPSQAKRVTNERLALLGALVDDGVPDHARDADRHAVMFLRRCIGTQGVSLKRSAWPHLYGIAGDSAAEQAATVDIVDEYTPSEPVRRAYGKREKVSVASEAGNGGEDNE